MTSRVSVNGFKDEREIEAVPNLVDNVDNSTRNGVFGSKSDPDPICLVGMACRLPGDIRSPSDLWKFLVQKRSAQGPVPPERFNMGAFYHPDGTRAGVMDADGGYFLNEDVRLFENSFFGINAMEATYMDPQQRKLLEVVYECFESVGLSMEDVSGKDIGVFVGNFTVDYQTMQTRDPDYMHRYNATGSGTAILSNRISHVFNLHGPSMTVDTACSSSIYCLHTALSAIRNDDCKSAIVAGANLIISPEQHLGTMKGGVLSPTSTCHTFDASADGYGRAEGVNAVYLQPLSLALREGNKIYAVFHGTATNSNGRTLGITQPSVKMQENVIRKAYDAAGLHFDDTDYIECHGTGTAVGDPSEVEALQACFAPRVRPLKIGSVKSNLGHSEAASGLTSLIKVAMAFEMGKIPPTYGVRVLNPKLNLSKANMSVVMEVEDWPRMRRRASINSFGYGGANAHVVVESFDSYVSSSRPTIPESWCRPFDKLILIPISAASDKSLDMRLQQTKTLLQTAGTATARSLAFTYAEKRPKLRCRDLLMAKASETGYMDVLKDDVTESIDPNLMNLPVAFIFTGQGAQYPQMGKGLLEHHSLFRSTICELDTILQSLPPAMSPAWTVEQTLLDSPDVSKVHESTRSQPICTAVQIGLINLLRAWGISPSAVVGHSSGEIAAAYAAGLLDMKQALLTAYFRGIAVGELRADGTMIAAGIGAEEASQLITKLGLERELCVACVNSPVSVTVSGSEQAAERILQELKATKAFARKLSTGGRAYHSHLVKQVGQMYEDLLRPYFQDSYLPNPSEVKMYSSVGYGTGQCRLFPKQARTARYWRDNLERSVQFSGALDALMSNDRRSVGYHLIEVGPHPALKGAVRQVCKANSFDIRQFPYSATLIRDQDAELAIMRLARSLYLHGHGLQWKFINDLAPQEQVVSLELPPYSWDYSAGLHWYESRLSIEMRNRKYSRHELLGSLQLGNNGIDWTWRNILRLQEANWLSDHRIDGQIVFPATGYLAIAMEAISQVLETSGNLRAQGFEFRNVSFNSALIVPDESTTGAKETEIHTTLSAQKISNTNASARWFQYSISSWVAGQAHLHCSGIVRLSAKLISPCDATRVHDYEHFDKWTMDKWYKKLSDEGFFLGPSFQSLTSLETDRNRTRTEAIAHTRLKTRVGSITDTVYPVHPVTIDACLQAAIMGSTAGDVENLKGFMPVFIKECRIQCFEESRNDNAVIHASTTTTGFCTKRINSTLLDSAGRVLVDMRSVRLSLHSGKMDQEELRRSAHGQRHPTLRISWKPDILRLPPDSHRELEEYVTSFTKHISITYSSPGDSVAVVGALLDLVGHHKPSFRALEVLPGHENASSYWLSLLEMGTSLPRIRSWDTAHVLENDTLDIDHDAPVLFDVLVLGNAELSNRLWERSPQQILSLLVESGIIITPKTSSAIEVLKAAQFTVSEVSEHIIFGLKQIYTEEPIQGKEVLIVHRNPSMVAQYFANALSSHLKETGAAGVTVTSLADVSGVAVSRGTLCISLLELEHEFLATMSQEDMDRLRYLTDTVSTLLWITGANMLKDPDPNLTLSNGLSRALMLEQPSLRFCVLDVGLLDDLHLASTFDNIQRALTVFPEIDDKEFVQVDKILFTSRFLPCHDANKLLRRRMRFEDPIQKQNLTTTGPARLAISRPGVTETLHFQQIREMQTAPPPGFIDVEVKAVSLNAKDIYNISGHVETKGGTSALEFCGVVRTVGPDAGDSDIHVGDRVLVMAPNHFTTIERVPAWSVHEMLPGEDFDTLCTLPVAYGTALYALHDRGHLRTGESVLIHAGAGAFGTAAINIAKMIGATVYTTCSSPAKRRYLIDELKIPAEHIFSSRDISFAQGIKQVTKGRGVDLVVNSLVGDLMHASWDSLANFGRFVEIGKRELTNVGKLQMDMFLKNTTFTAFDLSELFHHEDKFYRDIWVAKTKETLALYRAGRIKPGPITKYDVSEISQAFRAFSVKDRIGKIVVSLEDINSQIPVAPAKYFAVLDPDKIYLLVGCLGGLGRSLSRWMLKRGARHFAFIGRSADDKPSAKKLIGHLKGSGAEVIVARGDVSVANDVQAFVQTCLDTGRPIGGVVQAALGLKEELFSSMSNEAWHTAIEPKWRGTWNLHYALEGHEEALDFFLLTSSVSGSVATATESNYCAANGFLDAWARWRRSQGKKAISVGLGMISEVGYLHENPEIEALLLRKGIQPLNEEEYLQVTDLALSSEVEKPGPDDAHILTGLESQALHKLAEQGWDVSSGNMLDPRSSLLSASLISMMDKGNGRAVGDELADSPSWLQDFPPAVAKIFASKFHATSMVDAILGMTRKRFSALILMPINQIDVTQSLTKFGVDSMIAAEFRTWIWSTFKVDIAFLDLLSDQMTLSSLAEVVSQGLGT
ncbi:polyketide synthase [Xylaria sp. FL0043]|nr:polyketide synthase [Xylaria sp. FL0043]